MFLHRLYSRRMVACLVFLALAIITLRVFLFGNTIFWYRDDVWSSSIEEIIVSGIAGFDLETARRLIYLGPFLALGQSADSSLLAEKGIFLFTRFIMGFSAYFVSYRFLTSRLSYARNKIFVISIFMGFFYAYNPFLTEKMGASIYGFTFSYAMLPLIFYYFDRSLNEKRFSNIFLASLFISLAIAGTTQFLILLPLYFILPWFLIVVGRKIVLKEEVLLPLKNVGYIAGLFLLISSYWIVPAIQISVSDSVPQPQQYILTDLMLSSFSRDTTWLNGLRLMGAWWPYIELTPVLDPAIWTILTFTIPVVVLIYVLFSRNTNFYFYSLAFLAMILVILFFFKGSNPPFPDFYVNLYAIPVFGWMFRAPETAGIFLPFFFMMITGIGASSVSWKWRSISAYYKTAPLVVLIASTCVISWPMFTGDFGGIFHDDNSFKSVPLEREAFHPRISQGNNLAVIGGQDLVDSLRRQNIISPNYEGAIYFADNSLSMDYPTSSDWTVLDSTIDLSVHFLPDDAILLKPFDMTFTHDTSAQRWSRASTSDPLHGPFHPYLDGLGLSNKDIDYGQGLVFTLGKDTIKSSFDVATDDNYQLFARVMRNPQGKQITLTVDDKSFSINTVHERSTFEWIELASIPLRSGKHSLQIENTDGFNAVNLIILVPSSQQPQWRINTESYANGTKLLFDLMARNDYQYLNYENERVVLASELNDTLSQQLITNVVVPMGASEMSFELAGLTQPAVQNDFPIKTITVKPESTPVLYSSNFEDDEINHWYNVHPYWQELSASSDNGTLNGNSSLRVDVRPGIRDQWNVIETSNLIPIPGNTVLKYSVTVDAHRVYNLHSKVVYYDSTRTPLKEEILLKNPDRNFSTNFVTDIQTPKNAAFVKLQFWVRSNPTASSYYLIDDLQIELKKPELPIKLEASNMSIDTNNIHTAFSNYWTVKSAEDSDTTHIVSTPIQVIPGREYEVTFDLSSTSVSNPDINIIYSRIVSQNTFTTGNNISLQEKSEYSNPIEIPSSGYYTIAVKSDPCEFCKLLLGFNDQYAFAKIEGGNTGKWAQHTFYLEQGLNDLHIYAEDDITIQSILVFSKYENGINSLLQVLNNSRVNDGIVAAQQIAPDSYNVRVISSDPYMLVFPQEYDPAWSARIDNSEYKPIRLESGMNGFYISELGENVIYINYMTSFWLKEGWIITLITLVAALTFVVFERSKHNSAGQTIAPVISTVGTPGFLHLLDPSTVLYLALVVLLVTMLLTVLGTAKVGELVIALYYLLVTALCVALAKSLINYKAGIMGKRVHT